MQAVKTFPKGHDAILASFMHDKRVVRVDFVNDDSLVNGVVVGRDKYTITLEDQSLKAPEKRRIIFKHSIRSIVAAEKERA